MASKTCVCGKPATIHAHNPGPTLDPTAARFGPRPVLSLSMCRECTRELIGVLTEQLEVTEG